MTSTVTDLISGVSTSVAVKPACRVATTANITLNGLQTIDGVTVVANDRVLVKNQTSSVDNGIYVADTSTWARAKDFDGRRDAVKGTLVKVNEGTAGTGFWYVTSADPISIGTSAITWGMASPSPFTIVSAFGQTLVDDADAATARATLVLGSMATQNSSAVAITGGTISSSGGTHSNLSISGSSINNAPIGSSTPSSASFTSLKASSLFDISTTNAGQIKFPATQNPSNDANTFDDYVQNPWTPVTKFGGSTAGWATSHTGRYVKKGGEVTAWFALNFVSTGTSTGILSVSLPVDPETVVIFTGDCTLWAGITPAQIAIKPAAIVPANQFQLCSLASATTSFGSTANVDGGFFTAGSLLRGFMVYRSSQ
jgi:hypothetical protein